MKGVILGVAPGVQIVDVSHEISPQDIRQAAYVLSRTAPYFPAGAVHIAVVDPGVGGARRPLLVTTPSAAFVGPDNGLFTFALETPGACAWALDQPAYWLPAVSRTFHGRDIFAPVAAHLANGVPPDCLGRPIADAARLHVPLPARQGNNRITGHVIHVDRFGNLISNVPGAWVAEGAWSCLIASQRIPRILTTYAAAAAGELVALVSSGGTVEVAVREGNAAQMLRTSAGQPIEFWKE
jgi:S-adenosylmethionine hydrolase